MESVSYLRRHAAWAPWALWIDNTYNVYVQSPWGWGLQGLTLVAFLFLILHGRRHDFKREGLVKFYGTQSIFAILIIFIANLQSQHVSVILASNCKPTRGWWVEVKHHP